MPSSLLSTTSSSLLSTTSAPHSATLQGLRSVDEPLSEEQVAQYFRDGFLIIDSPQIGGQEMEWCKKILLKLIADGTGREAGRNIDLAETSNHDTGPSPQFLQPSLYASELRNLSFRNTALAMAKQLLGPDATFAGDHAILKPRKNGGITPWHQDEGFRDPNFDYEELSIWIALTESTVDNGAMRYIPGSHKLGVLPHRLFGGANEANSIECCEGFDPKTAAVCPISPGAMILHSGRTLHGASGNTTDSARLAYIIQYATPPIPRKEFRDFPWLKDLRKSGQSKRKSFLLRGGIFPELLRILRSDRYSHQHFLSQFFRRRVNSLRRLLDRKSS
jgi:Phytanoyl-CoA dioxygenase (PhyH)